LEGNDHKVSLLPTELSEMVRQIRIVEQAMGSAHERELSQGEMINRQNLAKSLVINCSLAKGQVIQRQMIEIKSPGQGLQPNRIGDVIGKIAHRDFNSGDMIFDSDIQPSENRKTKYIFQRPFGIPVRYHDYHSLINGVNIDFVEFHLSYHDLDLPLNKFFNESQSIRYAVHAPELFAGDHILDLATGDGDYLARSVHELTRTIEVAKQLKQYFPLTPTPVLVVNAGGWSTNGFLPVNVRSEMYERLVRALSQIDLSSIQLAIQTMPPFPWHFGGQSYHNLFVDPIEISKFCESTGHKVCLDISHSMMACNYYKWDMSWFLEKVLPYTIHLHISDAKGIDGEGVQIGEGDVDFKVLSLNLSKYAKGVPFIPEVWQGHKNLGEGFLNALNFLESIAI
jgi:N-acetylneuraminate synthase